MQQALSISLAFPYMPDERRLFKLLAAKHRKASLLGIAQAAELSDFEHIANWSQVGRYEEYLQTVSEQTLHQHVPFVKT